MKFDPRRAIVGLAMAGSLIIAPPAVGYAMGALDAGFGTRAQLRAAQTDDVVLRNDNNDAQVNDNNDNASANIPAPPPPLPPLPPPPGAPPVAPGAFAPAAAPPSNAAPTDDSANNNNPNNQDSPGNGGNN